MAISSQKHDFLITTFTIIDGGGGLVAKSCPTLVTPLIVALLAPVSMGFHPESWPNLLSNPVSEGSP